MIKPIGFNGYVFKMPKLTQIQYKNKCVSIFNNGEKIQKIYVDTVTGKVIKRITELLNR